MNRGCIAWDALGGVVGTWAEQGCPGCGSHVRGEHGREARYRRAAALVREGRIAEAGVVLGGLYSSECP